MCENSDGWVVASGLCECMLIRCSLSHFCNYTRIILGISPCYAKSRPAVASHSGGATGTARLLPRSQRDPQRGDLLMYLPGRPVVVDVCVTHPISSSAIATAAWGTGVSAKAKDALKRGKYGRTGTGACRFVPLSHETYGRAGCPAFALLHELAEFAASTGAVSKKDLHGEYDARPIHVCFIFCFATASHGRSSPRRRCGRLDG